MRFFFIHRMIIFVDAFLTLHLHTPQANAARTHARSLASTSGAVIELSNYLEKRISQTASEYASVSSFYRAWRCIF